MNKLIEQSLERVYDGEHYSIDLLKGNLTVGKQKLIVNWVPTMECTLEKESLQDCLETINELYEKYVSAPISMRKNRRKWFYCPDVEERNISCLGQYEHQFRLELYTLTSIINGSLYWDDTIMGAKHFFYKSNNNVRIFRSWINNFTSTIKN